MKTLPRVGATLMAASTIAMGGCHDSVTGPGGAVVEDGLSLGYAGGSGYEASGMPTTSGLDLNGSSFAVAFSDSLGGLLVVGLQQTEGARGNVFILQLDQVRIGSFGPCSPNAACHGVMLDDYDPAQRRALGPAWEIVSGSVQVDTAGPARVTGSVSNLVLQPRDTVDMERTISTGSFHLSLVSDAEGKAALACFLGGAMATAVPGCPVADEPEEPRVTFTYADGGAYDAWGSPVLDGSALAPTRFATAIPDSLGGLTITAFAPDPAGQGDVSGDLFILHVSADGTGSFAPCGNGGPCDGRVLERYDATSQDTGPVWAVTGGSVQVDTLASGRVTGSFTTLVLQALDSIRPQRTITGGTFQVNLLPAGQLQGAVRCFLDGAAAAGYVDCGPTSVESGPALALIFDDSTEYHAHGAPTFSAGDPTGTSFVTALTDDQGGRVVLGFRRISGTGDVFGDLFVLHLGGTGAGTFAPCGDAQPCSGRFLEHYDATRMQSSGPQWALTGGSVQLDTAASSLVAGTLASVQLQAQDSTRIPRTIVGGAFHVKPLADAQDVSAMKCFLARVEGSPGC